MEEATVVGRVVAEGAGRIRVCGRAGRPMPPPRKETDAMSCRGDDQDPSKISAVAKGAADPDAHCCGHDQERSRDPHLSKDLPPAADAAGTREKFQAFLEAANGPGVLGARTKRAMAIALSVLARCGPCVRHHVRKAREENFSPEEIEEAAWMAIAFGGSPTMMFYNDTKQSP
jgi:AhpD family alkylhydroperoxidase